MTETIDLLLLGLVFAVGIALAGKIFAVGPRVRHLVARCLPLVAFLACLLVAFTLREPTPRLPDEFSYTLIGDTLAHGRAASPAPPVPEFFDSFHILTHPVYASKYFPAQGIFLALGEKLTGHPSVGLWLSSALFCAAVVWMLEAWFGGALIGTGWVLLGGILMALQYGIFSYWSQSYWGGTAPALGGALFFGAIRRLWDRFSWQNSIWLALGLVILANSRPLEGALAALPATFLFLRHLWRNRRWNEAGFWPKMVLPCFAVLALGAFATGSYNRAITGSALKTPYMLHEQQYQESPPFIFMPMRPKLTYTSPILQYYYEVQENRSWASQRVPKLWLSSAARKLATWWQFYCGFLLSAPLVIPGILRGGRIRWLQVGLVAAIAVLVIASSPRDYAIRGVIDLLIVGQIVLLWFVFDDLWSRLAIGTSGLLLFELLFVKWSFPHYFAPAACLILYLQVEGLRKIWDWNPQAQIAASALTRHERRRLARESKGAANPAPRLRGFVYLLPIACLISLAVRVEARIQGWKEDPHGPDRQALLMDDWSLRRAELEKWMEQQPTPQLVFVRYSPRHNVNYEWVYNHADIMHSHVIWARDLGAEHNRVLLQLLPDRTVWSLEADRREPQLVTYSEAENQASQPTAPKTDTSAPQEQPE